MAVRMVCVPAYNEQRMIADVVRKCKEFADEVVVCDDGSTDGTAEAARGAGATVLGYEKNAGKGKAMRALFEYAKKSGAEVMVTIDGDGQFLPAEIPKLMKPVISGKSDVVLGYRYDDSDGMPSYRMLGNKMLDKMTKMASDLPFKSTQGGFRAYSKKAVDMISFATDGFGVDSEILIDASKKGLVISEENVTTIYKTGGKTSTKNPVSHMAEVTGTLIESIAVSHPLRYIGIPGIMLVVTGIMLGWYVLAVFDESSYFSLPFTFASIAVLLIGMLVVMVSVVLFSIARTGARR